MLKSINLLGVRITDETEEKVSEYVLERVKKGREKTFVVTPNPEILVYAHAHSAYKDKLNSAQVALADGVGLLGAAQVLGRPLKERITGVDFIEKLCRDVQKPEFVTDGKALSMGFLGGRGGVAEKAAQCLVSKYPWLNVVFIAEEWSEAGFRLGLKNHESRIMNQGKKEIDILFVAYGFPKQEEWIAENLEKLPIRMAMGVGGSFDYLSGKVARAPKVVRSLGLEWLFRLIREPWRIRRQTALFKFIILVLKERFSGKN